MIYQIHAILTVQYPVRYTVEADDAEAARRAPLSLSAMLPARGEDTPIALLATDFVSVASTATTTRSNIKHFVIRSHSHDNRGRFMTESGDYTDSVALARRFASKEVARLWAGSSDDIVQISVDEKVRETA